MMALLGDIGQPPDSFIEHLMRQDGQLVLGFASPVCELCFLGKETV